MSKLWGGRFEGGLDPFFERFNRSLPFDRRLVDEDITGSIAWARALGGAGVLEQGEVDQLAQALEQLREELSNDPQRVARAPDEDVHSFVERELLQSLGVLARKLHTGRSRNDQVATDLKLWLKRHVAELDGWLAGLAGALVELAEKTAELPLPGYTHLQRAQPMRLAHHLLAYVEMLARDRGRLDDAHRRMGECPLGAGALATTTFAIDREATARALGFEAGPMRNSLDAVSDRDFALELVFACVTVGQHLSRLCEELVLWASQEFAFVRLPEGYCSGSSIMPQKVNPDVPELVRAKVGRLTGDLVTLVMVGKALPLAYNKDLQESHEPLYDAASTAHECLHVMAGLVAGLEFDAAAMRHAVDRGHLGATEVADFLAARGIPFRRAHDVAGTLVRLAISRGVELSELSLEEYRALAPEFDDGVYTALDPVRAVDRRDVVGGPARGRVLAEIERLEEELRASL